MCIADGQFPPGGFLNSVGVRLTFTKYKDAKTMFVRRIFVRGCVNNIGEVDD